MFTKLLVGRNPKLHSFQSSLPSLPVPALKDTINRYLTSVRPILNDDDYDEVVKLSQNFLDTIASRLQRYLILKSWWSTNYVTDWLVLESNYLLYSLRTCDIKVITTYLFCRL